MNSFPQYNAEENLQRIDMEKRQKFLLVEGPFDLPIYEELSGLICGKNSINIEHVVLFGGGKKNILDWANNKQRHNVSIILDMDFDYGNYQDENNIIFELKRYSIENYFFDIDVVAPLISFIFKVEINEVKRRINLDSLVEDWKRSISSLIPILYCYQKVHCGEKSKWNNLFLCEDKSHSLCSIKISNFRNQLLNEINKTEEECYEIFTSREINDTSPEIIFPGKLLITSFYRYLKNTCNNIRDKAFSQITNPESLVCNLSPRLLNNRELENIISAAILR
ncbi:DUF4435 domain-containing protein [Vibrio fluvialis]|uniref:DUF4435 domain-containing protein n=1 Tax=Vibrio fluvialis TaxID=676 RepID=UPI001F3A785B|nr:DUF4435 domain-containing protein [Vibrio fluvialis]MCE7661337.1 DUF4435 domain-containing protein [Vibrio fluvialis]